MKKKLFNILMFLLIFLTLINLPTFAQVGEATYYSNWYQGRKMANGKLYDKNKLTCASNKYRFNTKLKVTNLSNNKSVIVTVTDRGNFSSRNVDLSLRAFESISKRSRGRIKVRIEVLK